MLTTSIELPTIAQDFECSPVVNDPRSPRAGVSRNVDDHTHEAAGRQQMQKKFEDQRKTEQDNWFVAARIPLWFMENRQAAKDSDSATAVAVAVAVSASEIEPGSRPFSLFERLHRRLAEVTSKKSAVAVDTMENNVVTTLLSLTPPEPKTMTRKNFNQWLTGENQHSLITYGPGTPDIAQRTHAKLTVPSALKDLISAGPSSPVSPLSLEDGPDTPIYPSSHNKDPDTPISPLSLDEDPATPISPLSFDESDKMSEYQQHGRVPSFVFPNLAAASKGVVELKNIRALIAAKEDDMIKVSTELHGHGRRTIRFAVLKFRLSHLSTKIRKLRDRENTLIGDLLDNASLQGDKSEDAKSKISVDSGYQGSDDTALFTDNPLGIRDRTRELSSKLKLGRGVELRRTSSVMLLKGGSIKQKVQCKTKGRVVIGEEEFAARAGF